MSKNYVMDNQAALEEFYGGAAAVPKDSDLSLYTDISNRRHLSRLYNDSGKGIVGLLDDVGDTIKQTEDALYGDDFEDNTLRLYGYEEEEQIVCEGTDHEGNTTYHPAGKTKRWIKPTLAA